MFREKRHFFQIIATYKPFELGTHPTNNILGENEVEDINEDQ